MDQDRIDEWARHYDTLLWSVTGILLATNGGLLIYSADPEHFAVPIAIGGMYLTGLSVWFAASIRELRHRVGQFQDDEFRRVLSGGRKLYQWWPFVSLFIMLVLGWVWLLVREAGQARCVWLIVGGLEALAMVAVAWRFSQPRGGKP